MGARLAHAAHARPPRQIWRVLRILLGSVLTATLLLGIGAGVGWWSRLPELAVTRAAPLPPRAVGTPSAKPIAAICTPREKPLILLTGSSTVDEWKSSDTDLKPLRTENIGMGATTMKDQLQYMRRIIPTVEPQVIVLYSGANDVAIGSKPADVVADVRAFVDEATQQLPGVVVYFVSINDVPARARNGKEVDAVSASIAALATPNGSLRFIDTDTPLLGGGSAPNAALFRPDGMHLNDDGYKIFSKIIRERLLADGWDEIPCV
ncbi:GDSL-type esterase/lipase family protein [Microbacterium sp. ZW T5_56]|uniref:GDSL-type esterase/lipase family protein n=1 Tax=Microbacterium sp. ZW T5_56 TaxID=3378081 RepID=UPI0038541B98